MLVSVALILVFGLLFSSLFTKLKLPGFIGMILVGIILGGSFLNVIDDKLLAISSEIRQIALIIILTRAGLTLKLDDLKKIGKPAFFMSFLPATFEIVGCTILGPILLNTTVLEGMLIGCVLAAVSPAVVVPRMIQLTEEGYGQERKIPQLILTGASFDDVFVIALFTVVSTFVQSGEVNLSSIIQVPIAILSGILIGVAWGYVFQMYFKKFHMRDSIKLLIILAFSFFIVGFEKEISSILPFSSLIAVMSMAISINVFYPKLANRLSSKYNKLWVAGEVFLFVLVGISVNITFALGAGLFTILMVLGGLIFRMGGVFISLLPTKFTNKEKLFCAFAYLPKATVQAAIGGIPLAMGLACGELVLTVAVLSILISAPLGAILIDSSAKKLLTKS
ncbi:cation:proton antiporter [Anaerorhabdus sp.]|uniref:cation:proton antiporter n=1 Tax=Anaerorhabdus sp. TaxID=1872524 RepID=UPI002B200E30|nr:cation:proton antiporter [Anaerorhabdus sp.]MEA4874823.1 cation:proton antiporter [Anaerorhabdus sp.]